MHDAVLYRNVDILFMLVFHVPINMFWHTLAFSYVPLRHSLVALGRMDEQELVPNAARLVLEYGPDHEGRQQLLDVVTLSRCALLGGPWTLVVEDGWAILVDDAGSTLFPEDLLHRQLASAPDGELWVIETIKADGLERRWSLHSEMTKSESILVGFVAGPTRATHTLSCSMLAWPRAGGCRCFWKVNALYTLLGMRTFKKQPSKWWYEVKASSLAFVESVGAIGGHILEGTGAHDNKNTDLPTDRFTTYPTVSTFALIALLSRWAWSVPKQGGLRDRQARKAAACVLRGLIASACAGQRKAFPLRFVETWSSSWPRSSTAPCVTLPVGVEGTVGLEPLVLAARRPNSDNVSRLWLAALSEHFGCTLDDVTLFGLLECAFGLKEKGLFGQAVSHASLLIELNVLAGLKKPSSDQGRIKASTISILEVLDDDSRLQLELTKHVLAGKDKSSYQRNLTIVTDKWSYGVSLQWGFMCTPHNDAWYLCPVVPR